MFESLISLVYNFWYKRQLHINTNFSVTRWMLCVIPHIRKYAKYHLDSDHRRQVNIVIKKLFYGWSEYEMAFNQDLFCTEYTDFITIMVHLMGMNLYIKANTSVMVAVICGIKNIHFLAPRLLVLLHVESSQRFLLLAQQRILGVT